MDELISRLKERASNTEEIPFDLEILTDELLEVSNKVAQDTKEKLHQLGQEYQKAIDSKVNSLKDAITAGLLNIKNNQTIDPQYFYKVLKKLLELTNSFETVFSTH